MTWDELWDRVRRGDTLVNMFTGDTGTVVDIRISPSGAEVDVRPRVGFERTLTWGDDPPTGLQYWEREESR